MADERKQQQPRKKAEPEGALPKEQQWTVGFLNDSVTREYKSFNADLKAAFWDLHDDIRYFGLRKLTAKQAKRLAGTKDMWELRFKGKSGIGRGLYVQRTGRKITILVFFTKKSDKLPKQILDLAVERRKTLEEVVVEAMKEDRMKAQLINAQDVYDEEYPPGSKKREMREQEYLEHVRKWQRRERIKALPRKTKEALVARLLRKRNSKTPLRHAAG